MKLSNYMVCSICNRIIEGQYRQNYYNQLCCNRHELFICYCCGRYVKPKTCIEVPPYGLFCPDCQLRLVNEDSAVRIARLVNRYYSRLNLEIPDYSLKLITESRMISEAGATNVLGLAFNCNPYEIHIIRHLSRTGLAGVLAHEVLHLWQYANGFSTSALMCDGMCEFGSYMMLKSIDKREACFRLQCISQNSDKIYGGGFRLVNEIYQKFGWKGVIKALMIDNK